MRHVVLVSGAPGAGKTSVATPLAAALGLPLLSKDALKERLYDSLGIVAQDPLEWSRRLSAAAMDLLLAVAAELPCVVLDANFRPRDAAQRRCLTAMDARVVEVHCRCPAAEAARRYAERARRGERHPAHVLAELPDELLAEFAGPVAVGPVIWEDTTDSVDITVLARRVQELLGA